MNRTTSKYLALALLPLSGLLASCRTGQTMWAPCEPGNDPWGTDGTYVLICRDGEWQPTMTVQEYVQLRQGKKVTFAPLPTKPTTTTTTTTTTAAPTTTSTTTTTTTSTTTTTAAPVTSPSIFSINAPGGNIAGGATVVIGGAGFTGTTTVTIGGNSASFTVDSDSQITATTPAHAAGEVDVVVTNPSGSDTLVQGYEYLPTPVVNSLSPSNGTELGGTTVTVSGSGFAANDVPVVTFGAVNAATVNVVNDTTLTVVTPAQAPGTVNVRVNTYGGLSDISVGGSFTYDVDLSGA